VKIDSDDRLRALRLVAFQAAMAVVIALAGWMFSRWQIAVALAVGGAVGVAGSAWLAVAAFSRSGTRPAKEVLASFYIGETGRLLVVVVLFVVAFRQLALLAEPINAMMMFLAFVASQVALAAAPLLVRETKA